MRIIGPIASLSFNIVILTKTIGHWQEIAPLPSSSRVAAVAFTIKGKAYVFGGCKKSADFRDLWMYDPVTNKWAQKKSCPEKGLREPISFRS